jgi:hypothetical protein
MADCQITCTTKDGPDSDRRIDALGGPQFPKAPIDKVIALIEAGKDRFWTVADGKSVWIEKKERNGAKYLTTQGDGYPPNNLLKLPDCP